MGLVGLMALLSGPLCFGSHLPKDENSAGHPSAVKGEIPFQLYNDDLIIVRATIGTMKNVNMIIDTGANPSAISRELADRLQLRGELQTLQTLNGTIQTLSLFLPFVQIGPVKASPIRVVVQDLNFLEQSLGIALGGVVGLDILSTSSFAIDYRRKKIIFGRIAASEKAVRFETQQPFLTVKGTIEGQPVQLLVDSGASGLVVYHSRLLKTRVRLDSASALFGPGGMTQVRWSRARVSLGKDNLGVVNVVVTDKDSDPQNDFDGLLGFTRMGFRKVSFDFENGFFGWQ